MVAPASSGRPFGWLPAAPLPPDDRGPSLARDAASPRTLPTRGAQRQRSPAGGEHARQREAGPAAHQRRTSGATTPARPALDKTTGSVSASARRELRYELREGLRTLTHEARVAGCGRTRIAGHVEVRRSVNGAHFAGLLTCGRVWLCPVCAAKIAARRAGELQELLTRHLGAHGGAEFLTLTLPHTAGDALDPMRRTVGGGLRAIMRGRAWVELRAELGIAGHVRVLELAHGAANGWHAHAHVLVLADRPLSVEERERLRAFVFARWSAHVQRAGYGVPLPELCPLEPVSSAGVGMYVTKLGAALELTHGMSKQGRNGSRSPWQVLAGALRSVGDADGVVDEGADLERERDRALWGEYERGMRGARQLEWSRGLKARYGIGERTDDELAAEDVGGELVAHVPGALWDAYRRRVVRMGGTPARLLDAAERHGSDGVTRELLSVVGDLLPATPPLLC